MTWTVIVAKASPKSSRKSFPLKDQVKIEAVVQAMALDPFTGDVIKWEGGGHRLRRRVGSYRMFFAVDFDARKVEISAIVRRSSTTC
jgi:mRNA-degrading endonuclease RelE of RelBE toxin-antitoxin system